MHGITLIALVVTIVVLLILAGITISLVFSDNGIIKKAQEAKDTWENAIQKENNELKELENEMNSHIWTQNGNKVTCSHCGLNYEIAKSTINYIAKLPQNNVKLLSDKSGYIENQTFLPEQDIIWVVLGISDEDKDGINESLLITTREPVNNVIFYGATGYLYGVDEINRICKELYSNDESVARSITIEDINNTLNYVPEGGVYTEDGAITCKTTGNFTTKVKTLNIWDNIKSSGTKTPDGINTEDALGEYELNGYSYGIKDEYLVSRSNPTDIRYPTTKIKNELELILGPQKNFEYWVASNGFYIAYNQLSFGISNVGKGWIANCGDLFSSVGNEQQIEGKLRPVVALKKVP